MSNNAWYEANKEEVAAYAAGYYAEHRSEILAQKAKWRAEHKSEVAAYAEGYYAAHKDFIADQHAEWRANNPDKKQASHSRRRARKVGVESDNSVLSDLIALYGSRCLCCGAETILTVDHVVPLFMGGSDLLDNKQPLCKSCNSRKGVKTVDYRVVLR